MIASAQKSPPLLSIVLYGRNDSYNPDNLYRLATTLNLAGRYLAQCGALDRVEFLIVDYKGNTPLSHALTLNAHARALARFVVVPADQGGGTTPADAPFLTSIATNIGIRRARGEFILVQGLDLLMSHPSWKSLLDLLAGSVETPFDLKAGPLMIPRRAVPRSFSVRRPTLEMWDRWLKLVPHSSPFMEGYAHLGWAMGAICGARSLWHELGGLDERFNKWGFNDIDFALRGSRKGPAVDLSCFGIYQFKPEHDPAGKRGRLATDPNQVNPHWTTNVLRANDANWGEASSDFAETVCANALEVSDSPFHDPMPAWFDEDFRAVPDVWRARLGEPDNIPVIQNAVAPLSALLVTMLAKLCAIAWCCRHRFPMTVLELGHRNPSYSLNTVSLTVPSAELYVLEYVDQEVIGRGPMVLGTSNLKTKGFTGHLRPMVGDVQSSLAALAAAFANGFRPELAIVDLDAVGPAPLAVFKDLLSACRGPMFLVVSSDSTQRVAEAIQLLDSIRAANTHVTETGAVTLSVVAGIE